MSLIAALTSIPGPQFLWYFAVFVVICIVAGRKWANRDTSTDYPLPAPGSLDSLAIAALRGGPDAVIHTVVFDLWNRGLIRMSGEGPNVRLEAHPSQESPGGLIHHAVYHAAQSMTELSGLLQSQSLRDQLEAPLSQIMQQLEALHLLKSAEDLRRSRLAFLATLGVTELVGGTKLIIGISRNKPVFFLLIILAVLPFILWSLFKSRSNQVTRLGKQFLKVLQDQSVWMKDALKENRMPQDSSPSMALAIFGVSALMGIAAFEPIQQAFAAMPGTGGDSSWAGGCGSSSDSGGCGGSDGGGGGCGGCGGGD